MEMTFSGLNFAYILPALMLTVVATAFSSGGDEEGVRKAAADFYEALNAMFVGDIGPMKDVWSHADDVTYMGPQGGMLVGWSQIGPMWDQQAALKLGGRIEAVDMQIHVGPSIAVTYNYENGENEDENGNPITVRIRATNTFRKENGEWKMIGHHTDILPFLEQ